ncbi:hypothetical protein [Neobacillus terrae]|uniref:hypothetical protein n=1 Tax=Neobacillus terrae TaxID=3034837 RepID=UPI00140974AC|nr:hypothetical protein [Neobacillus terrae]NHM34103.1 hypothetical protein [Neobacillus terrae]
MAFYFSIGPITINSQNTNSTVSFGENQQSGWTSNRKTNNGVGLQAGIFGIYANKTVINDNDTKDGNMIDEDNINSTQGQGL